MINIISKEFILLNLMLLHVEYNKKILGTSCEATNYNDEILMGNVLHKYNFIYQTSVSRT